MENGNLKQKILIGSNNRHKMQEIAQILPKYAFVTPADMGLTLDVIEDGKTFEENAVIKARAFCAASGLITLADDSGLEVDALNGEPGIFSARYSPKPDATDADRRVALLENLAHLPQPWTARFYCAVAIVSPLGAIYTVHGICAGRIVSEERGRGGFGYDPIFYTDVYQATLAELNADEKNLISHRGKAVRAAGEILAKIIHTEI